MDTQHHITQESGERLRAAGRSAGSSECASAATNAGSAPWNATHPRPTARQIAEALVRWVSTGTRR